MTEVEPGLRVVPLERFFHPRVVAVIGASGNRSHPSARPSSGSPPAMTARSMFPGTSWIERKHATPSISSRPGLTGWTTPPSPSTLRLTVR